MMLKQMGFNAEEEKILKYSQGILPRPFRRRPVTMRAFKKMKVGKFIIQVDNYAPIMVKNRKSLLGNIRSMSEELWEKFKEQQMEKYYAKPFNYTPTPLPLPTEEYNPFEEPIKNQSIRKEKNALRNKEQVMGKRSFRTNIVE